MPLNNIRISTKLPAAFVVLSLTVVLAISWMGYRDFKASLIDQSSKLLGVLTAERGIKVETWFDGIASQVSSYAGNPAIVSAVQGFGSTFGLLMDDPVADLHAAYITNNPHPLGDKNMLDRAPESIPYHFQHGEFHPVFNAFNERLGLYDFFLFNLEGDLIYSVEKETDFATNFDTGPYKDSGLGLAFRAALQGDTQTSYFVDFMPYAPSHDAPAAFISSPVVNNNGATIGVLAIQVPAGRLNRVVTHEAGLGVTGDLTIIGPDLLARTASRFTDRHEILGALTPNSSILEAFDATASQYAFETGLSGDSVIGATHQINVLGEDWLIVGEFETSEVLELAVRQRNKTLAFTTIAMMIVAVCGWLISRTFSKPLDLVVTAMTRLTQREYDAPLPDLVRQDEIGDLSRAVTLVADRLQEFDTKLEQEQDNAEAQRFAVEQLGTGLKRLADGDFSAGLDRDFAEEYEPLRVDFNDTVTRLGETIADLKEFSTLLETQTDTISRDSNELSQRTENQASTLEETAAAIDQITETITQSSNDLHSAERLILEADGQVKQGRTVVETTTKAMDEIEKSSSEISSIIRVVDDIAFQTNLLALNAGVEAARAGDAGRGFAVVASEVRQLAMRSTEAVSQIKALIETSTANVGSGVTLVRETEAVLMEIVRHMEGISTVITSVTAGAAEQSGSIGEINTGVNNLDRVTQQNAMMVENSNASVQSLTSEATKLVAVLSNFKVRTNGQNVVTMETAQFSSRRSRDPSALSV